jgi:LysM domain
VKRGDLVVLQRSRLLRAAYVTCCVGGLFATVTPAAAQNAGEGAAPAEPAAAAAPAAPAANLGVPAAPPNFDPNAHLDSSSRARADISRGDNFDFEAPRDGAGTVRGNPNAGLVDATGSREGSGMYVVRDGDTLSKISETVYGKPWMWPKLWSQNPQIQNPHWIYPGDQVRLASSSSGPLRASGSSLTIGAGGGRLRGDAPPAGGRSVFVAERGYIEDPSRGIAGEVVGAVNPVQLISQGDSVYVAIRPGQSMQPGQTLQIFRDVRDAPKVAGARQPPGKVVAIKGAIRLDYVNQEKLVARGIVTESRDVIERGDRVAEVPLSFFVVPEKQATKNVVARLLTSLRPVIYVGREDVVFIDRGSEDGLVPGNRLFVIRRGDTWRRTLDTSSLQARTRVELDAPELEFEVAPQRGNEQDFPEEIVGEIRVLRTQRFSSYALVTGSKTELIPGDRAVTRVGF